MPKKKTKAIQRVEINQLELPIHCPFCGVKTYIPDPQKEVKITKCEHLLFFAHDMELEYRSDRFDDVMGTTGLSEDEIDLDDDGLDGFTDRVKVEGAVKFAFYQGAPSFYGTYIGYAPVQE